MNRWGWTQQNKVKDEKVCKFYGIQRYCIFKIIIFHSVSITFSSDLVYPDFFIIQTTTFVGAYPAGTWCNDNVIIESKRQHNVVLT